MSLFSENLEKIKRQQELPLGEIAAITGIDASTIFRWMNGQSVPESWEKVEVVLDSMKCTSANKSAIRSLYQNLVIGEREYQDITEILNLISEISKGKVLQRKKVCIEGGLLSGRDVQNLNKGTYLNKRQVLDAMQTFFVIADQKVSIRCHFLSEELSQLLADFEENIEIYYCKNIKDDIIHLRMIKTMIRFMQQKDNTKIYVSDELNSLCMGLMNIIISGTHILLYTDDMMYGCYFDNAELVSFYKEIFIETKTYSREIGKKCYQVLDLYADSVNMRQQSVRVLEYEPGLSVGLTKELMEKVIYSDVSDRKQLIDTVMEQIVLGVHFFVTRYVSIFDKFGLLKFMEEGRFANFPYEIYRPLELEERKDVLRRIIRLIEENEKFHYYMVNETIFYLDDVYLEERQFEKSDCGTQGGIYIQWNVENRVDRVSILDDTLREKFASFFDWIVESEYVYTERETLEFMKSLL